MSEARSEDVPTLINIINQAYVGRDDLGGIGWSHESGIVCGPRIRLEDKNAELNNTENNCVFKYEENGEILGCVFVKVTEVPNLVYAGTLSVTPSYQAKGVGRALLAVAENWARQKGCSSMKLTVVNIRKELIEYYKRRG